MTTQRALSYSSIDLYRQCALKWVYKYEFGLETPSTPSTELGSAVHAQVEAWLAEGIAPDDTKAGRLAQVALPLLPPPKTVHAEATFRREILPGVPFVGHIDAHWYENDKLIISDLKTTSDYKWAKTAEDLKTDVQTLAYGYLATDGQETPLEVQHVQVLTRGTPDARKVGPVPVKWEDVEKNWTAMQDTAKRIQDTKGLVTEEAKTTLDVLAVVPKHLTNHKPCSAYGGCPFRNICPKSDVNFREQKEKTMATPEQLARRAALLGGAKTTPSPEQNTSILPPDVSTQDPVIEGRVSVSELAPGKWRAYLDMMTISKNGINAWPTKEKALEVARAALAEDEGPKAEEEAPKKTRGRPKKSETAATKEETPVQVVVDTTAPATIDLGVVAPGTVINVTPSEEAPQAHAPTPSEAHVIARVPTLYVSCYPMGEEVEPIEKYLAPIEDEVAHEQKTDYYGLIDFGKGPKLVLGKLIVRWTKNPPTTSAFIGAMHPYCEDVVSLWRRAGGKVVRGVR